MTIHELLGSGSFQAFFQFAFEEALQKYLGHSEDVNFLKPTEFTLGEWEHENEFSGEFRGAVETPGGGVGESSGKFALILQNGLTGEAHDILDAATINLEITEFPGG